VHDDFRFVILFAHSCMCHHDAVKKGGLQPYFFLVLIIPVLGSLVKPKVEEQTSLCFPLRNSAGISGSFSPLVCQPVSYS
jgi:hypothetical protein